MNSRVLIVGVISVVIFGSFLFKGTRGNSKVVQGVQNQASASDKETTTILDGKAKSMGAVEVEVTPVVVDTKSNMAFDVALNTHSVDLSYDYIETISAEDDQGKIYEPVDWSGGEGGHHLSGQIVFEPISQKANKITLIIDGIDNEKEIFEWDLK